MLNPERLQTRLDSDGRPLEPYHRTAAYLNAFDHTALDSIPTTPPPMPGGDESDDEDEPGYPAELDQEKSDAPATK